MITLKTHLSAIMVGLALVLTACSEESVDDATAVQIPETAAAIPETVDTDTLVVEEDFSFQTARTIDIDFNIADAQTEQASVSICTEYYTDGENYDINYDSCPVKGRLEEGAFSHTMEVTNAYDSVVAIVWFQNPEVYPIFQEFEVATGNRSKQNRQTIVWHR